MKVGLEMFKKVDNFKKNILPDSNQKYLSNSKKVYEKFGKTIERDLKNPMCTTDGKHINDYFALFDDGKPDIMFSEKLLAIGEWQDYGTKLYRINTLLKLEEFKTLLLDQLDINPKEVLVTSARAHLYIPFS